MCRDMLSSFLMRPKSEQTLFWIKWSLCSTSPYLLFSDAPHLVKKAGNCLFQSGSDKCTRCMWNEQFFLLLWHVAQMYYQDVKNLSTASTQIDIWPHQPQRLLKDACQPGCSGVECFNGCSAQVIWTPRSRRYSKVLQDGGWVFQLPKFQTTKEHQRKKHPF